MTMTTFAQAARSVAIATVMLMPVAGAVHAQDYDGGGPRYQRQDDGDQEYRRRREDGDNRSDEAPRRRRGGDDAAGIAAGVIGGIAGAAAANNGYDGSCHFERRPIRNEDGDIVGRRRVRVCE